MYFLFTIFNFQVTRLLFSEALELFFEHFLSLTRLVKLLPRPCASQNFPVHS